MIYKQTKLKFGNGDIEITSGVVMDTFPIIGVLTFKNQTPREIGSPGDTKIGVAIELDNFPVIMEFTKKESIDAVIRALKETKIKMEEGKQNEGK